LEVLKSRYITGFSASSCKKAKPLAAPRAIFILMDQGRGKDPANIFEKTHFSKPQNYTLKFATIREDYCRNRSQQGICNCRLTIPITKG